MNIRYLDCKKQETELYNEIWELSEELDRLYIEGKDATGTIQRFGEVLEEFLLFRQQGGKGPLVKSNPKP
ncbi:hypothetical protein SPSIL_004860 [Sporomusa silvacetica DSM 10669]|uniref:Site-specific DNA-methyltransferase (adenine-specific) n=1 Tax=Sporomusa silvacetica DSM 10669 TaxID=1123289 RepID=A0ABZ3IFC3_9FIRM|nr:hypothetical protein [Sporomusa silvacetica]OZC13671.1 hypothetical protein SPSIL_51950 [Sporomusa silvacetica DSM 10669]